MNAVCPHCSVEFPFPDAYAGQESKCPACRQALTLPLLPATTATFARVVIKNRGLGWWTLVEYINAIIFFIPAALCLAVGLMAFFAPSLRSDGVSKGFGVSALGMSVVFFLVYLGIAKSVKATKLKPTCSECRNWLDDKSVRMCPHCRTVLMP